MTERRYGDDKTIHRTGYVDVEIDEHGNVASVWFRCQPLPFKQTNVSEARSDNMREMYARGDSTLKAVVLEEGE